MTDERYLFIGGHRKCATTMMLNLFDGHPECCVFPTDISVLYGYYPVYCKGDYTEEARLARLDSVVFGTLRRLVERHELADRLAVEGMREHFFDRLDRGRLDQIGTIVRQIVDSFRHAAGLSREAAPVVVIKETSLEIYTRLLSEEFPGARFLQLLRDPRDNLGALHAGVDRHYRLFGENERHILASLIHRVGLGLRLIDANVELCGRDSFQWLRMEDLVAEPEATLRRMAAFAGLTFDDTLLRPTVLGAVTPGNNYDGERFFEITGRNVGRWRERIGEFEAQVIEFHLGEMMEAFGYRCVHSRAECAAAAAEFYEWTNYRYFFKDSFAVM